MNFQGAISDLMKAFLGFYIGCCAIGRADIPLKIIAELRTKAIAGTPTSQWGCPSIFHKGACQTFNPAAYH